MILKSHTPQKLQTEECLEDGKMQSKDHALKPIPPNAPNVARRSTWIFSLNNAAKITMRKIPCIPYVWIFLENLSQKGLIGTPRYFTSIYPAKK